MHSPQFSDDGYGLGWQIWKKQNGNTVGHSGGNIGVSTLMKYDYSKDLSIIYLINRMSTLPVEYMIQSLIEGLLFMKGYQYRH